MIQERYIRDNSSNYMTIESAEKPGEENYQVKMLLKNTVSKFLPISLRAINNSQIYCYDISSKQPISRMYEGNNITREDVVNIAMHISQIVGAVNEYLLELDSVVLNARFMYMNISDKTLYFTYYPHGEKEFRDSLRELFEFILEHLDHNDKKAVMLTYGIYQKILQNNYNIENLIENIAESESETESGVNKEIKSEVKSAMKPESGTEPKQSHTQKSIGRNSQNVEVKSTEKAYTIKSVMPEIIEGEKEVMDETVANIMTAIKTVLVISVLFTAFNLFMPKYRILKVELVPAIIIIAACLAVYMGIDHIYTKNKMCFTKFIKTKEAMDYRVADTEIESSKAVSKEQNKETEKSLEKGQEKRQEKGLEKGSEKGSEKRSENRAGMTEELREQDWGKKQMDYAPTQLLADYLRETGAKVSCRLVVQEDSDGEKEIVIRETPFIIGTLIDNCNYAIENKLVSRMHVRITREKSNSEYTSNCGNEYFVEDLNSTNGTYVNGNRIEPNQKVQISEGDILKIAVTQFRFWID